MFRAVPLPIIRSFSAVQRHWYNLCTRSPSCINCTSAVVRLRSSWWWAEGLPETCRFITTSIKIGTQCLCWFYSQGICHDARSYNPKITENTIEIESMPSQNTEQSHCLYVKYSSCNIAGRVKNIRWYVSVRLSWSVSVIFKQTLCRETLSIATEAGEQTFMD
jgi:hypothetical protein